MSIIQEALKKAQGDYTENMVPGTVDTSKAARPQKEEVVYPKKNAASSKPESHMPRVIKKVASTRLPAVVGVLLILLLAYGLKSSLRYSKPYDSNIKIQPKADATPVKQDNNNLPIPAAKLPETFNPSNLIMPRPATFILNGIMYLESKPQAIINGNILEEGDKINGATVVVIEKDCVLLELNDANIKLELGK